MFWHLKWTGQRNDLISFFSEFFKEKKFWLSLGYSVRQNLKLANIDVDANGFKFRHFAHHLADALVPDSNLPIVSAVHWLKTMIPWLTLSPSTNNISIDSYWLSSASIGMDNSWWNIGTQTYVTHHIGRCFVSIAQLPIVLAAQQVKPMIPWLTHQQILSPLTNICRHWLTSTPLTNINSFD